MAQYQNTSVDSDRLIIGNWKIETASSAAGTYVNLGAGQVTAIGHEFDKWDVEAGNAPDPIEGIAEETFGFSFEMIEYDASTLSALQNGLVTATVTTSQSTIEAGGNTELVSRAYRLSNTRVTAAGSTVETVITVFKGTIDSGFTWVTKSDNDSNPINALQFSVTAELDTSRTVGTQLYTIVKTEV